MVPVHSTWRCSHPQHSQNCSGALQPGFISDSGHGTSVSDRGSSSGSNSGWVAGTWGLNGPLLMEGTQEALTLSIPSYLARSQRKQVEQVGLALRGPLRMPLPPKGC